MAGALARLAAQNDLRAFGGGIGDIVLHLAHGIGNDQWPECGAGLKTVANFHICHYGG